MSFLKPFVARIGTVDRLDILYCLTWADARAVGEGVLTGWQEALLGELYEAVRGQLTGVIRSPDVRQRLVAELMQGGIPQAAAEQHLSALGVTYEHQMAPGEALRHWRVLDDAQRTGVGMLHDLRDRHVHLTLSLPDRHGLFADVAATLSGNGFDIIDLRTWITAPAGTNRGFVVYTMRLASIYPGRLEEKSVWDRLRTDLLAASNDTLDAKRLLDKRRSAMRMATAADSGFDDHAIKVDSTTSDACTILDIVTKDEVGLLSKLCRAISSFGCGIGYACINTMGDVAVDVFYVTRDGKKLSSEDAEALRQHLIAELGLKLR